jgi:hypothetical protein
MQFALFKDLPTFLQTLPRAVKGAHIAAHKEALTAWRDNKEFPGLAHRFTWAASRNYGFSMRREKYGRPTQLRVNAAKQGLQMPRESMPGRGTKHLRLGAKPAPNIDNPWFKMGGELLKTMMALTPKSHGTKDLAVTRMRVVARIFNLLGGQKMRGVCDWKQTPRCA